MAIAKVQQKANSANGTVCSITLDSTPTVGNLLIGVFGDDAQEIADAAIVQTNVAWAQVGSEIASGAGGKLIMCVGVVSASPGTQINLGTDSSAFLGGSVIEVSGLRSSPFEGSATSSGTNHTSTTATLATTYASQILVAGHKWGTVDVGATVPTTPTNSFLMGASAIRTQGCISLSYRIVSAAGSYSTASPLTGVFDDSEGFVNILGSFKMANDSPADVFAPYVKMSGSNSFTTNPRSRTR